MIRLKLWTFSHTGFTKVQHNVIMGRSAIVAFRLGTNNGTNADQRYDQKWKSHTFDLASSIRDVGTALKDTPAQGHNRFRMWFFGMNAMSS